jgi:hypothetical protein
MADYTFQVLQNKVRYTQFVVNGKLQNLHTDDGVEKINEELMADIVNRAIREVNFDIFEDFEVVTETTEADKDEITLPVDIMLIKDIIIKEAAADLKGVPLESVASYNALVEGGTKVEAMPCKYYLLKRIPQNENTPVRIAQFDTIPKAAYSLEIHYWKLPGKLSADTDVPTIYEAYEPLIIDAARVMTAEYLGDDAALNRHSVGYITKKRKYQSIQKRFSARAVRVRYGLI